MKGLVSFCSHSVYLYLCKPSIENKQDIPSHCSFFALVWWIWASQVAYNVRFRQSDWLHRLFVLLQLLVFCILATFTKSFDVTNGLINNTKEHSILINLKSQGDSSLQDIAVEDYRPQRIATLNARGISMTIAFSRVVLLAQYLIGKEYQKINRV